MNIQTASPCLSLPCKFSSKYLTQDCYSQQNFLQTVPQNSNGYCIWIFPCYLLIFFFPKYLSTLLELLHRIKPLLTFPKIIKTLPEC